MESEVEEYVTLFCEGDGSVSLDGVGYPHVVFIQKEKDVLEYIGSVIGSGHLYGEEGGVHKLCFNGSYCLPLLEMFSRHVVSVHFLSRLNTLLSAFGLPLASLHPLTWSGFVGFWDAEGSSGKHPSVAVYQKDLDVLEQLRSMFGGGIYGRKATYREYIMYQWRIYGARARSIVLGLSEESRCSSKVARLLQNFGVADYFQARNRDYYYSHKEERQEYNKDNWQKHREVQNYIDAHPEVVDKLREEGKLNA